MIEYISKYPFIGYHINVKYSSMHGRGTHQFHLHCKDSSFNCYDLGNRTYQTSYARTLCIQYKIHLI
jgi:hypothetical protein